MPASPELGLDLAQLRPHPFRDRDAPQPEPPAPGLRADVREAQEVERLRLAQTPRRAGCRRRAARTRSAGSCPDAAPARTSRTAREARSRNRCASSSCSKPDDEVVSEPHDDHITVRVVTSPPCRPTGRRRSAGTRSRATATPMPPAVTPPHVSDHSPSSMTPAASHFSISRRTRLSAIRCSRNLRQPAMIKLVKKSRMSASSTQFTFFRSIPTASASNASCGLRPGRNPYEKPRKSTS